MKIVNWGFFFLAVCQIPFLQFSSNFQQFPSSRPYSTPPIPTPPPSNSKFTQWVQDGLNSIDEQPAELSKFQLEKVKGTVFKTELSIGRLAKVEQQFLKLYNADSRGIVFKADSRID